MVDESDIETNDAESVDNTVDSEKFDVMRSEK